MAPVSPTAASGVPRGARRLRRLGLAVACAGLGVGCTIVAAQSRLIADVDAGRVEVRDGAALVLAHRLAPVAGAEAWRLNYTHPLHAANGAVLTEDGPADHVHQRGVFWAWRRILVDGVPVADGWVGRGLVPTGSPTAVTRRAGAIAETAIELGWSAPVDGRHVPLLRESVRIRVHPRHDGERRVEYDIGLLALRDGVALAGTDDDKEYGGWSIRFARSADLEFASGGRRLVAAVGPIETSGPVAFRWRAAPAGWPAEVEVSCEVDGRTWNRWVLRREASMQNCAFPGRRPHALAVDRPLRLRVVLTIREPAAP
jgi:hypothetical protein